MPPAHGVTVLTSLDPPITADPVDDPAAAKAGHGRPHRRRRSITAETRQGRRYNRLTARGWKAINSPASGAAKAAILVRPGFFGRRGICRVTGASVVFLPWRAQVVAWREP